MPCISRKSLFCLIVLIVGSISSFAQSSGSIYEIRQTKQAPVIDGRLDDVCWRDVDLLTNFTQVLPVEGAAPTEKTEVRFAYTSDYLFIAVRCFDGGPDKIIAKQMQHDGDLDSDDMVTIAFDTFFRQRDGYFFATNPVGARVEGLIENLTEQNRLWDTVWQVRSSVDKQGWTAEIAIPFKSLSFDPKRSTWGCNIERVIRRKQETVRWTAISITKSVTSLTDFGELRGLSGMQQGLGLEAKPFISTKYQDDVVTNQKEWKYKPGSDFTYNITPSLKANLTFNTDFAEADVDERIANLSRFPLFFPEKRDFFLQDSSIFNFGGLWDSPTPYYSRRIGLSADRKPVDIIAGARLTGRIGNTRVALLDVQQDKYEDIQSKNLFVGRVSTKISEYSDIGLIATHGDPLYNGNNSLVGFDYSYFNSHLPNDKQLIGHGWLMFTSSDRMGGDDTAFGGDLEYPNEPLDTHIFFRQIGEKFDPALGFVERRGIRDYSTSVRYTWRPNTALVRSITIGAHPGFTTDLNNRIVAENHQITIFDLITPAEDQLSLEYFLSRDVMDEPFEIRPGIIIPQGDYSFGQIQSFFRSSEARPVGIEFGYSYGGFYSGTRQSCETTLDWRPSRYLTAGVGYELGKVELNEGSFDVRVANANLDLTFTPDLSWNTIIQYENFSGEVWLNSRIRWTYSPGSDLFLVVNNGWNFDSWNFQRLSSELAFKLVATFRF